MRCKHYYNRNLNGVDMHFCACNGCLTGGWIKCSDRLPDKNGLYLIHLTSGFTKKYDAAHFYKNNFNNNWGGWSNDRVTRRIYEGCKL